MQAQHLAHADGHVGIRAEVQIDLHHEGRHADPGAQHGHLLQRAEVLGKKAGIARRGVGQQQRVHQCAAGVGKQGLFGEADAEAPDAVGELFAAVTGDEEFLRNAVVAHDGPGDALVKQRGIQQHVPVFLFGGCIPPVHVRHIGQQLEGIKRDADGQGDARDKIGHRSEQRAEQPRIFEKADQPEVDRRRQDQPQLSLVLRRRLCDAQGAEPVRQGHPHQKQHVFRLSPGIEDQGEHQQ